MALVSCPQIFIPSQHDVTDSISGTTYRLDASGEIVALIIPISKSGNIRTIHFRTGTVAVGFTVKYSLQSLNATGDPSGTILGVGNSAYGTVAVANGDDNVWKSGDLGTDCAVTIGDIIAVCLEDNSFSSGNDMYIAGVSDVSTMIRMASYGDQYASSAWTKGTIFPCIAVAYDDGSFTVLGGYPFISSVTSSFNSGTNPDEIGLYFQLPFPCRVIGAWAFADMDQTSTIKLYGSSTITLSMSSAIRNGTGRGFTYGYFSSALTLAKDTWYRLTMVPDSTTTVAFEYVDLLSAAAMDALELGQKAYWTERTDAGAWTESTTKRPAIGLIIDQVDDGTGAGGSSPRFGDMTGGLR